MPIFRRFDENSLNSNQTYTTKSFTSQPEPTTTMTINDYAFNPSAASGAQAQALNERAAELRAGIHDVLGELMVNRSPDEVLRAAEAVHESSNGIAFLECLLNDLHINGVESEAFAETLFIAGQAPTIPSPLEQFAILPLIPMNIGHLYFSFTNPSLFMLLTLSLVLLLVHFVTKNGGGNSVPNAWQSLVELIYDFVPNPVNEQIGGLSGNVKQKFSPRISVTFTFSFFRNPQGMIPYSFTVTSHFLITLGLSFSIFIGITLVGFQRNGLHFLSFSLPAGVPLPLAPFLVLLELIPHCFRALSSGIRLFANMMAGHSSVKILSGFAWTMLCMNDLLYFIGDLGPLFIVLALTGPELGVAISQAHVSTISICIYLNDATNLHQSEVVIYN
uniref:ATP synthase subunit a n=4 Tax=apioid superclade TaxID=241780 RepID=A0A7D3JF96_FOEVU|nr:ATPase subunit 6 [Anethum foeniculum]